MSSIAIDNFFLSSILIFAPNDKMTKIPAKSKLLNIADFAFCFLLFFYFFIEVSN
jgi:hypothetical protein